VEEIGRALGVTYREGEELKAGAKEAERDRHRWELDPASAEDYAERESRLGDGPSEEILAMSHSRHQPNSRSS
jgi:hypothetical protein